jgi:hypothetical protein
MFLSFSKFGSNSSIISNYYIKNESDYFFNNYNEYNLTEDKELLRFCIKCFWFSWKSRVYNTFNKLTYCKLILIGTLIIDIISQNKASYKLCKLLFLT